MDLFPLLRRVLKTLDPNTPVARRDLYARARKALETALRNGTPPASDNVVELEMRLFQVMIRAVEIDIRAKVDIYADGYQPPGVEEARKRLVAKLLPAQPRPSSSELTPDIARTAERLAAALENHSQHISSLPGGTIDHLRRIYALLKLNVFLQASSSRLALGWMILRPLMTMSVIIAIYLFLAMRIVQNMEVPGFVAVGIISLAMYHQTSVRCAASLRGRRFLFTMPIVAWFDVLVAEGIFILMVYSAVFVLLIAVLVFFDLAPPPDEYVRLVFLWGSIWLAGLLTAPVLTRAYALWPFVSRLQVIYFRVIMLASGTFFVSEQLPSDFSYVLLFNPLLHVVQACRDAYFAGYKSADVNLPYFYTFLLLLAPVALFSGVRARALFRP